MECSTSAWNEAQAHGEQVHLVDSNCVCEAMTAACKPGRVAIGPQLLQEAITLQICCSSQAACQRIDAGDMGVKNVFRVC